jgi:2-amino-4-hydroxy-6-hydroxymethyldihydropteridine diphosphokinase
MVLRAAFAQLDRKGLKLKAASRVMTSAPLGPSRRRYANAAALVKTRLAPDAMLAQRLHIEGRFGRRPGGQRWSTRVLDLDIVLWSGGPWVSDGLVVPHVAFRDRPFALAPAAAVAPDWRDPLSGLTLRQLDARLTRNGRLPIGPKRSGP